MNSYSLIIGANVVLVGGEIPVYGKLLKLTDQEMRVKVTGAFFPSGYDPEKFIPDNGLWKRVFPDPFSGEECSSMREPRYKLNFCHDTYPLDLSVNESLYSRI